jgi:beta-galactosidase GanA/aryl-phospho-beta-D-glucosidase BglC (GH1 family)
LSHKAFRGAGFFLLLLSALVPATIRSAVKAGAQPAPLHAVTWDSHSVLVDGRRVLLYSGEFHYFRLPSVSQWTDRLEKMKAAGLNAVSIYFDWQYHSPQPGVYDFTGVRDVNRLLDITDRLGLYVLARVGPYMNAEADAGGLPGWLLSKQLFPRAQAWDGTTASPQYSPLFAQYAKEWYDHILPIIARHQVTNGGSVLMLQIENEYSQTEGSAQYMQELYSSARSDGIQVPIFHNDYWFRGDWSKLVDLYAFDSYPFGFSCCHQWWDLHFHGVDTWESNLRSILKINTPLFVSELQGGSFDPWGGVGYDAIANTLNGDWLNVLDQSALAQGAAAINTYMFAGGTTWGYMGNPAVYTSYDYGAPISESGGLRPAFYSAHRLGMFLNAYGSSLAGSNATPQKVQALNPSVVTHARTDPSSGQMYLFLRHGDAGAGVNTDLTLRTGSQKLTIPQEAGTSINLPGHGARLLLADAQVGPLHLNYTTSDVLTDSSTPQGHYLVLYGPDGSDGETDFQVPQGAISVVHNLGVGVSRRGYELRLNYSHTAEPRTIAIATAGGTLRILITSASAASRFWQWNNMLVSGPALLTDSGGSAAVQMAANGQATLYGAPAGQSLLVDGQITATPDETMGSILLGSLAGPSQLTLPSLAAWKFQSEAPETNPAFDDSHWITADHATTANPNVPANSTLLADDYGFHYGYVWYRGHFTATGQEAGITLWARQSYSVFLNGIPLGGADEALSDPPHTYALPRSFTFPATALKPGSDNVVSVLTESLGHDEGWLAGPVAMSPQGIVSAQLQGATTPISWKIQGNAGGEQPANTERGLTNASGLYGERNGWYLPSFDDAIWSSVQTPDSWSARNVTSPIGWYRAHFSFQSPAGTVAPIGLTIPHASDKAVIWVNGWLMGRYWEQKGPQHTFYLPEGVLNPNGDNVVAIAVWNRGHLGGLTATPALTQYPSTQTHTLSLAASPLPQSTGYWHTQGNRIVDESGRPVRIAAVNWFGMENKWFVPAGLDKQPLDSIMSKIRGLGFNSVRLPFSNQMVESNPIVEDRLDANPELKGLHALDIMDRIVASARLHGLRIILDDGRSSAGTQPEMNGLWYTAAYPESSWIQDWKTIVTRYLNDPTVVAVDLRNEPHTAPPGPWSVDTYLHQGATWGAYNGIENELTDWHLGAERGGNAVLGINPNLLVMVEGIQQYPNPTWTDGIESYWWGGILYPARDYPVLFDVPHQLVYSPHEYGPLKWEMPFFGKKMSYSSMSAVWEQHWGFLEESSFPQEAPIFIGEFGTCGTSPYCFADRTPGSQGLWFTFLMHYLRKHPEIGWSYWAVNGTNPQQDPLPQYILKPDWKNVNRPGLIQALRDIMVPASPGL